MDVIRPVAWGWLACGVIACAPASPTAPDAERRPPPSPVLQAGPIHAGFSWTLRLSDVPAGTTAVFAIGPRTGTGTCPTYLLGGCWSVAPTMALGSAVVDADGVATLVVQAPQAWPFPSLDPAQGLVVQAAIRQLPASLSATLAVPWVPGGTDTDGDGLEDGLEATVWGTDPTEPDTDGDGLADGAEVGVHGTDPTRPDSDDDRVEDGVEVSLGLDPLDEDSDHDGALDFIELERATDPLDPDTDGDGTLDGQDLWPLAWGPWDPFVVLDDVVSDPAGSLLDPEFDAMTGRFTWLDARAEQLWVGRVNDRTGALIPPNGRGQLVLDGVGFADPGANGPEWVRGVDGPAIVYARPSGDTFVLATAYEDASGWSTVTLGPRTEGISPIGSLDDDDPTPRVLYGQWDPVTGIGGTAWRELVDGTVAGVLPRPVTRARWVPGTRDIVAIELFGSQRQVFRFDIDAGTDRQLTSDATDKVFAWPVDIPDFGGDAALLVARGPRRREPTELALLREVNGAFVDALVLQPPPGFPYIGSPEPFVVDGRPYVSFVGSKGALNRSNGEGQIYIAALDPDEGLIRRVSDTVPAVRKDAEVYTGGRRPWLYYTEVAADQRRILHRCELGL